MGCGHVFITKIRFKKTLMKKKIEGILLTELTFLKFIINIFFLKKNTVL